MITRNAASGLCAALVWVTLPAAASAAAPSPFHGSPATVPGTIESEDFDHGGEATAYHDLSPGNEGGGYRQTDVDVQASTEGGYNVGWISAGEWLAYTVHVAAAGPYLFEARVAAADHGGTFHVEVAGTNLTGTMTVPDTGDWQSWTTVSTWVTLSAGLQTLRVVFDANGRWAVGNLNWIGFRSGTPVPPAPPSPPPTSYTAMSDRVSRAKPALPALGPAGFRFIDPAFSSAIVRVTDAGTRPGSPGASYRTPSASPQVAWNAASTYFYIVSTDGTVIPYSFDAATMRASRIGSAGDDGGLTLRFNVEPQFSSIAPNLIYGISIGSNNRTISRYDLATDTYSTIVNLDTIVGGLSGYVGGVMTGGLTSEHMTVFFGGGGQDQHRYLMWFPLGNLGARKIVDTVASTINGASANVLLNFHVHAVTIDRSGRYVFLYPTGPDTAAPRYASRMYIWDTATDDITAVTSGGNDGQPPAYPSGHGAAGFGFSVNQDCCVSSAWDGAQWVMRSLAAPLVVWDLVSPVLTPQEVYLSDHPSWTNAQPDVLVPIITGTYRYGNNATPWRAWDDEIIAIETGAPSGAGATVWRFAHHRSDVRHDANPSGLEFWYLPRPNVSPDGRWVIFTSNWEKTLGMDPRIGTRREDVFLLQLK